MKPIIAAAALALIATPAFAAISLPDGTYDCTMDGYISGSFEIVGSTYKGPAFDGNYEGTYDMVVDPDTGNITFKGPVGGYTEPGFQLIGGMVVDIDGHGTPGIQLEVRQDGSENIHFVQCGPRG